MIVCLYCMCTACRCKCVQGWIRGLSRYKIHLLAFYAVLSMHLRGFTVTQSWILWESERNSGLWIIRSTLVMGLCQQKLCIYDLCPARGLCRTHFCSKTKALDSQECHIWYQVYILYTYLKTSITNQDVTNLSYLTLHKWGIYGWNLMFREKRHYVFPPLNKVK